MSVSAESSAINVQQADAHAARMTQMGSPSASTHLCSRTRARCPASSHHPHTCGAEQRLSRLATSCVRAERACVSPDVLAKPHECLRARERTRIWLTEGLHERVARRGHACARTSHAWHGTPPRACACPRMLRALVRGRLCRGARGRTQEPSACACTHRARLRTQERAGRRRVRRARMHATATLRACALARLFGRARHQLLRYRSVAGVRVCSPRLRLRRCPRLRSRPHSRRASARVREPRVHGRATQSTPRRALPPRSSAPRVPPPRRSEAAPQKGARPRRRRRSPQMGGSTRTWPREGARWPPRPPPRALPAQWDREWRQQHECPTREGPARGPCAPRARNVATRRAGGPDDSAARV